ncbi:hypothetical protein ABKV19_010256 [Rosa sericea]
MEVHARLCRFHGFEICCGAPRTRYHTLSWPCIDFVGDSRPPPSILHHPLQTSLASLASCRCWSAGTSSPHIMTVARDSGETLYGLTHSSRWLLHDSELTLAPMVLMETNPTLMAPWHCFSQCVKQGGPCAFEKAHGRDIWQFFSENTEYNRLFNDGMVCTAKITMKAILAGYKGGFDDVATLMDVGGGIGSAVAQIVKLYPSIKGINFDLPHVVATAPVYHGVSHVGGDMFDEGNIPNADAIFMKWIMHDWSDSDCVKILKNSRNAIQERSGKVILVDIVLELNGDGMFDDKSLVCDLLMIAHASGGKERTESEWKNMLEQAGFPLATKSSKFQLYCPLLRHTLCQKLNLIIASINKMCAWLCYSVLKIN